MTSHGTFMSQIKWLRERKIRGRVKTNYNVSILRLQLESVLDGHDGCVNCLDWNDKGDLLASGSDDLSVIVWDPYKAAKRQIVRTKHKSNIFSVKFQPKCSSRLVATCGADSRVSVLDIASAQDGGSLQPNHVILDCKSCHKSRVKRLSVHPNEPYLLWSAGEDGRVMQFDLRTKHECNSNNNQSSGTNKLIDLNFECACKCLAINPIRSEMLAIGTDGVDALVRLYDRRMIAGDNKIIGAAGSAHIGHIGSFASKSKKNPLYEHYGITYVAFSPDGSQLLANFIADKIYLFELNELVTGGITSDYSKRYHGHCNIGTDIKEANFMGPRGEYVVAGSDDGACYIWHRETCDLVKAIQGDELILNCLQPHPSICMLATSGIATSIKLWSPKASGLCRDVQFIERRCKQNDKWMASDPWDVVLQTLYPTSMQDEDIGIDDDIII